MSPYESERSRIGYGALAERLVSGSRLFDETPSERTDTAICVPVVTHPARCSADEARPRIIQ